MNSRTNLEDELQIKHDSYDSLKQHFELIKNRNAVLKAERLEYIVSKDDQLTELHEKQGEDYSQQLHEKGEIQTKMEELQQKCRMLSKHNARVQETCNSAEDKQKIAKSQCASYRAQLELERQQIQEQLEVPFKILRKAHHLLHVYIKQQEKVQHANRGSGV